jgi:ABC-type glycerol-3-phosphate transport system substrate-binding protein
MKKAPLLTILFVLLFVLTACGSGNASTNTAGSGNASTNSFRSGAAASTPLDADSKLALGTLKLEGTKQAIDPKMAANLIPLWQLLYQLKSSTSSAPQEVTAVVDQIKATMTPVQVSTINNMTLSQADIFTAFQQANGSSGTTSTGTSGSTGRNRGGGNFIIAVGPGGGGPPGGGGFPGGGAGGGVSTSSTQTPAQVAQAAQARQNAVSSLLINQVIKLLQSKLSS